MSPSIQRLTITVGDVTYALAPTEHVRELTNAITHQVRSGGGFVEVTADDGQCVSILVTPTSVLTIAAKSIDLDADGADGQDAEWSASAPTMYDGDTPYDVI